MNEQDKLFELYKIYIPINYDYEKGINFEKIREESFKDAKEALQYFNNQLKKEEQNGRTNSGSD